MLAVVLSLLCQLAAALSESADFPVYIFNSKLSGYQGSISESAFPIAVSHFLGDGKEKLAEEFESVLNLIPSPFLEDKASTVIAVHNFDTESAVSLFGSAELTVDSAVATWLAEHSAEWVSPLQLENSEDETNGKVVRVNAEKNGVDYNVEVLKFLQNTESRVMVIGIPSSDGIAKKSSNVMRSLTNRTSPASPGAFFSTEEECIDQTNSCSKHGKCVKSSTGYYTCRCSATQKDNYTYYWGGNDCSKRDVSSQFSLLIGTTIAIIIAGALSVKLLFNLGSEPLPGILNTTSM